MSWQRLVAGRLTFALGIEIMSKKHHSVTSNKSKILIFVSYLLIGWAGIILIFNIGDFTSDAIYQTNHLYPLLFNVDEHGNKIDLVDIKEYSGIVIDIDYKSRGAFVAGKDNPVEVNIKMQPLGKPTFFNEIKDNKKIIKFIFNNTRGYPPTINKIFGGPEPEAIEHFDFDGTHLNGKQKLYYLTGGEFTPMIHYGDEIKKEFVAFQVQGQKLFVASQDVSLQLINNSRIFALTILIIGLTLIQISKQVI